MKEEFLDFEEFKDMVVNKRKNTLAMRDAEMFEFDKIYYDSNKNEYVVDIKLKDKYHDTYKARKSLVMLENTHLIHWAEWLDIGILIKKHPHLEDYKFLVTEVEIILDEPCYIDQRVRYDIKILADREKKSKYEFVFLHMIEDWVFCTIKYILMKEQIEILEYYHKKHVNKIEDRNDN
jgi:hypothetical protein